MPAEGTLFGAWMRRDDATTQASKMAMWSRREQQMGRRFDIANRFYPFTNDFPGWAEEWDLANGRSPSISWGSVDTYAVNRGDYDALIRDRARGVADLNGQVFLRWFWEMDGAYQQSKAHSPADYINAWKRVRRIFREEGATNAVWTWCATSWGFTAGHANQWYPGDSEVDWVCANGYNWAPVRDGDRWESWETIYRKAHDFAVAHNKPLMAGEWGALERGAGDKAAWIDGARRTISRSMPNMAAIVAYDETKHESRYDSTFDWTVDSSASSLLAFVRLARDPHFTKRTAAAPPVIDVGDARLWEGNSGRITGRVPVTMSTVSHRDVTVRFTATSGTATSGDFVPVDRIVTIPSGSTRVEVGVTIPGDGVNENRESFRVRLSDPAGAVISDAAGAGVLFDDDPASVGRLQFMVGDVTLTEGIVGDRTVRVPITMTAARHADIGVVYEVLDWTAGASDFSASRSGILVIPAGQRQTSVAIRVHGDVTREASEAVFVRIIDTTAGTIADDLGVVTIRTDD